MITLSSGYFYVDENPYFLFGKKEHQTLSDIQYKKLEIDKSIHILSYIPEGVTSDGDLWTSSEIGILVTGEQKEYLIKNSTLYVKSNSNNPIIIHGFRPYAVTSENRISWVQTELVFTSEQYTFLIPTPSDESPIIITDDNLLPTDQLCYQQHRFSVVSFNDDYTEILLNSPTNLFPDPDFSNSFTYSGEYSSESADILGRQPKVGYIEFNKNNYISPATKLEVLYSGRLSMRLSFIELTTGVTSDYVNVCSGDGLAQIIVGPYTTPTIWAGSDYVTRVLYTGELFESVYNVNVYISGEHIQFIQLTPEIYKNEFTHNRFDRVYIEYATSEVDYITDIDPSPYLMATNKGFLAFDECYSDTTSDAYNDFRCPIRSTLPYGKLNGANKYHNIPILDPSWMTYPDTEYRYGHDRPEIDTISFGFIPTITDISSDIVVIANDRYLNKIENARISFSTKGKNSTTSTITPSTSYTEKDGVATAKISFLVSSEPLSIFQSGEVYAHSSEYNPSDRYFIYDVSSSIYQHGIWLDVTGFTFSSDWIYKQFSIDETENGIYPIRVSGEIPVQRCEIFYYKTNYSSDLSIMPFTAEDYRILKEVSIGTELIDGCFVIENGIIKVNSESGYLCIKYKQQHIWNDGNTIFFSPEIAAAISSEMSSAFIAYDISDTVVAECETYKIEANVIYPHAVITKQEWESL